MKFYKCNDEVLVCRVYVIIGVVSMWEKNKSKWSGRLNKMYEVLWTEEMTQEGKKEARKTGNEPNKKTMKAIHTLENNPPRIASHGRNNEWNRSVEKGKKKSTSLQRAKF